MDKKIAVVLSGCGFQDGSEITEAVSALIAIGNFGGSYQCFAPALDFQAKNHRTVADSETRNMLDESARIARGQVLDLNQLDPKDFDAIVFPGGFGAALHLSTWAKQGAQCTLLKGLNEILTSFHKDSKPIGGICIAPVLIAKALGSHGVTLTIGSDPETAQEIEKTGALHENCTVDDYITDRENKIITTPAYMYGDSSPSKVFKGISGMIQELVEMA